MLMKIISGGQTGADHGGLRAGRRCGIPTGGTMPKGFLTEVGGRPEFRDMYGVTEDSSSKYPPRTRKNAKDSDGTIRFAVNFHTAGEILTLKAATEYNRPTIDVDVSDPIRHEVVAAWIEKHQIKTLNVAGNREYTFPGMADFVEEYLCRVIELLG